MAFRGRGRTRGGHTKKAYGGPQLPSTLRKQIAAQGDGVSRGATRGGTLNHRERRKLDKKEKLQRRQRSGTNKQPHQAPSSATPASKAKQQAAGKSKGVNPNESRKRKRTGDAPKTKFEELLALENKGGSSYAQADIDMEKRLAKKLKLKDGKVKGPQDGFDELLGGLKDFGGQESDDQDSDIQESDGQDSDSEGEQFEGSLGESESDEGLGFESDEDSESDLESSEQTNSRRQKEQRKEFSEMKRQETKQETNDSRKGGVQKRRDDKMQDGSASDDANDSEPSDGSQELRSEPSDGSQDESDDEASAPSTSGREKGEIETDIFGRPKRGGPADSAAVKYVPPHLRAAEKGPLSEEMVRLQRRIRGLLNRLTEANVESITNDMVLIFQTFARHSVVEFIKEEILGALISGPRGNDQYAAVFAAFLAGLSALVGVEIGANFLGALMVSFEEQYRRQDSLACRNLALVLAHLYNFQLLSSPFIYEFLHHLCARFGELDVATIAHLLQTCGLALRTEDPVLMKDFVLAVQKRTTEENASFAPVFDEPKNPGGLGEKAAEAFREKMTSGVSSEKKPEAGLSNRVRFMLDTITDTKNNRKRGEGEAPWQGRLKKWLSKNNVEAAQLRSVKLAKALDLHKKGLWWLPAPAGSLETSGTDSLKFGGEVSAAIEGGAAEAERLLQLASKQRMNTDVRRSIFCIIMSSEDYVDAHEKLLRLKLAGKQDREILRVLVDCCMQEKCFNKYYALLASRLCSQDHNHKFTLQYCVWDHFKQLPTMDLRRSANLARFLATIIASFALSLSLLKAVDFTDPKMDSKTVMHFRILLETLLLESPRDVVLSSFSRIAGQPQLANLREGLSLFFHRFLISHQPIVQSKERSKDEQADLLLKRIKAAKKAMSKVVGTDDDLLERER